MNTCPCGGKWLRTGTAPKAKGSGLSGHRYLCATCGKTIVVRGGEISSKRGRPFVKDWRHEMGASQ